MIVGDVSRFAIEFNFDPNQVEPERSRFCFGYIRFLLNGSTVGDLEEFSTLGTVAALLRKWIKQRPFRRAVDNFCEATAAAVFAELDWVVYGVGRDDESLQIADPRERPFRAFFVNPLPYSLDDQKIVVINCGESQRMIWQDLSGEVREVRLDAGESEAVAGQFVDAVDRFVREGL